MIHSTIQFDQRDLMGIFCFSLTKIAVMDGQSGVVKRQCERMLRIKCWISFDLLLDVKFRFRGFFFHVKDDQATSLIRRALEVVADVLSFRIIAVALHYVACCIVLEVRLIGRTFKCFHLNMHAVSRGLFCVDFWTNG